MTRHFLVVHPLNSLLTGLGYAILTRDFPVFSLSPTAFRVKCLLQACGGKPEIVQSSVSASSYTSFFGIGRQQLKLLGKMHAPIIARPKLQSARTVHKFRFQLRKMLADCLDHFLSHDLLPPQPINLLRGIFGSADRCCYEFRCHLIHV
jgi:hypothetical protein